MNRKTFLGSLICLPFAKKVAAACGLRETARTGNPLPVASGYVTTTGSGQYLEIHVDFDAEDAADIRLIESRRHEPTIPAEVVFRKLGIAYIALLACLLTGCANLGQMLQPETDPAIVRAEDVASRAQLSVDRFLKLQSIRPNEDLDARYTAKNLEGFKAALNELRGQLEVYEKTGPTDVARSPDAREALRIATVKVEALGNSASRELAGPKIANRGDTFAPPLPTREDELRMIAVSNSTQIEQLTTNMTELNRKLTVLLALQNRQTNAAPPTNVIPSRVP